MSLKMDSTITPNMKFFPALGALRHISKDPLNSNEEDFDPMQITPETQNFPLESNNLINTLESEQNQISQFQERGLKEELSMNNDNEIEFEDNGMSDSRSFQGFEKENNFPVSKSSNIKDLSIMNFNEKYSQLGSGLNSFQEYKTWLGPESWKYSNKTNSLKKVKSSVSARDKFDDDFIKGLNFHENIELSIEEVFEPVKIQKPKLLDIDYNALSKMNVANYDHKIDLQTLFRLFLLPASFENAPQEAKEFFKHEKTFIQDFDMKNDDDYQGFDTNENAEMDDGYGINGDNFDEVEQFSNQNIFMQSKKVLKSRSVPIVKLKNFISEKVSSITLQKSSHKKTKNQNSMEVENSGISFQELLKGKSEFENSDVSLQTWFVTLLHLANEKEYKLSLSNHLGDFFISGN